MPQMNFDLEDGKPPVSFSIRADDCERFAAFMAECEALRAQHVGTTQEIWAAINVDLQQIVDDASCGEGRWAESLSGRLEAAITKLNAAVGHERQGYETAIALGYENDKLREQIARHNAEVSGLSTRPPG